MLAAALAPPRAEVRAGGLAGELLLHDVVQLGERAGLHAIERRDAHHDVGAHVGRQSGENLGRLVRLEVGEHDRDDLRMLEADQLGHGARVHPLQRLRGPWWSGRC